MEQAIVRKMDGPLSWRLTFAPEGSTETEEVVLRIQGVLCEKDLPPVTKAMR
jgi:hypothetical protein